MTNRILIKNGLVLSPKHGEASLIEKKMDVRIKSGIISEVGESLPAEPEETVLNATGLWVTPGFIDLHTHLRDLGQADREDIYTGTRAAACGGYTTVLAMANTKPPVDNVFVLSRIQQLIKERAAIEVLPVACVTKAMEGKELTNMVELSDMGAAAFSDDGMPISNLAVLRRALEYATLTKKLIISHPEDHDLSRGGCMSEGPAATRLGLPGIPAASEAASVAREIEVVRQSGGRLHFAHVSTAAAVSLISHAKASGLMVTADVTPHHLCLTDEDTKDYDTAFKMNPPLRTRADQEALIKGLADGTIDIIATDHAPHTKPDKAQSFDKAPFGIIGLETAFALVLQRLVVDRNFSPVKLIDLFTTGAGRLLGDRTATVTPLAPANIAILDTKLQWTYDALNGFSKSQNSPFHGRQLTGKNVCTIYNGTIVYQDQQQLDQRLAQSCAAY